MLNNLFDFMEYMEYWLMMVAFVASVLMVVAYLTVAERKTMGYMQRRLGPNAVGYYGVLMAVADALKLLSKEMVLPHNGDIMYVMSGPLISLFSVLLSWAVMPFGPGLSLLDSEYSMIYLLASGSMGVFGTVIVGWMSNSKYTVLATVRTTAQLMSYELVLTTVVFMMALIVSSLNINVIMESQYNMWYIMPFFPLCLMFFISALAETARPPFDNVEAESELVSGHMTELSASPFVMFFLSEYCSMVLMSTLTAMFFFGGYLPFSNTMHHLILNLFDQHSIYYFIIEGILLSGYLAIKANFFMFSFVWIRAAAPRLRYDLLILFCWYVTLPIVFAIVVFAPGMLYCFDATPVIM
ncbi:unnamed protein product (mitochondrion) [Komagataella phaffii CBS 7435]|uniref:NADH-ubiquinone oxidoreductase chain 1 n=1 Tax=Komagataella phaffii (strain ATCC 76273 / CBS 7435 / CECT 11047 / NRRL Y-11430 / Wegner 21-1) TaxID=981350 RepID=F2R0K2_KOMPC|nr:unnamed protein product [Komagataella phaffii CBS 7435]